MSTLYRVVNNLFVKHYGVKVGDICTLNEYDSDGTAWFHNHEWFGDGVWCLVLTQVEEILEEN